VVINTRATPTSVALTDDASWQILFTTFPTGAGPIGPGALPLRPYEAVILRLGRTG